MNAATSIITTKSPYITRSSLTLPQNCDVLGTWACQERRRRRSTPWLRTCYRAMMRSVVRARSRQAGGEIAGSVRMPIADPDFSAFVQRAKIPIPMASLFSFRRIAAARTRKSIRRARHGSEQDQDHGPGELTDEGALKAMGDSAIGIITACH